jgi:hypothetical protein
MKKRVVLYISGSDKGSGRSITSVPAVATAESPTRWELQGHTRSGGRVFTRTLTRLTSTHTRLTKDDRSTAESGDYRYGLEYYQIIF